MIHDSFAIEIYRESNYLITFLIEFFPNYLIHVTSIFIFLFLFQIIPLRFFQFF